MEKELQERNIEIENELNEDIKNIKSLNDILITKSKYLGKNGIISALTKNMRDLSSEDRALTAKYATEIRNKANELLSKKENDINEEIINNK